MTKVELFELIRKDFFLQEKSIRQIARERSIHRRQVRQAIKNALPPERKTTRRPCTVMTPAIESIIHQWVLDDQTAPKKQRHTAKRVYERLCQEHLFIGALATVQKYFYQKRRQLNALNKGYIPQVHLPGEEAEVDWYEAVVDFPQERKKVYVFQMRACHSGYEFHKAFFRQNQQSFLAAHVAAFQYFGGVFKTIRYDNLTSAVKKVLRGRQRKETDRFIAMRSHYLFESFFCLPGIQGAHEKGGVEGGVGRFRRAHFVPVPKVSDMDQLNQLLLQGCAKDAQRTIAGQSTPVKTLWQKEYPTLKALPDEPFDTSEVFTCRVNTKSLVSIKTNRYSVPTQYIGQTVEARVDAQHITLFKQGKIIASHVRCYQIHQTISEVEHYLALLKHKPGALAGSQALAQAKANHRWPKLYDNYWKALLKENEKNKANRLLIDFLLWARDYDSKAVNEVLKAALDKNCYLLEAIKMLMRQHQNPNLTPAKLNAEDLGDLMRYERRVGTIHHYDQLLSNPSGANQ